MAQVQVQVQVLVRDIDKAVMKRLKARAERHGRSLQMELKTILEQAARQQDMVSARKLIDRVRAELAGRRHSDSVDLIREDRER
jgi:plasmid stability protein